MKRQAAIRIPFFEAKDRDEKALDPGTAIFFPKPPLIGGFGEHIDNTSKIWHDVSRNPL
jgi:hypothetical protein